MTTKYIITTYANGYTLAPTYSGIDIEPSGSIAYGLTLTGGQAVSIVDDGGVSGAQGANNFQGGPTGAGGVGLTMKGTATLSGSGAIVGGHGGNGGYYSSGGAGGTGAALAAGASLTSYGTIAGGAGGTCGYGANGGAGGAGVILADGASLTNAGVVIGGAGGGGYNNGGVGGAGVVLEVGANMANSGTITGGYGGSGNPAADGGAGVELASGGSLINTGIITGGEGGSSSDDDPAVGGAGVELASGGNLINTGVITGGEGGVTNFFTSTGGAGVTDAAGASVMNTGTIVGGSGGYSIFVGGRGGAGLGVSTGAGLTNIGTIIGGAGGASLYNSPGLAGDGVDVSGGGVVINGSASYGAALISGYVGVSISGIGTVTNFGTIQGTSGAAVVLSSAADRLIVEEGAAFIGAVEGGGGALQLAGGSGTITGLGGSATISGALAMTFSGFGRYALSPGGAWTLTGANTLASGQKLFNNATLDGSCALDTNGRITNGRTGVIDADNGALTIDETGSAAIQNRAVLQATNGGALLIEASVLRNTGTIADIGGDVTVDARVKGDGTALIDGGTLAFEAGFGEDVTFAAASAAGKLRLADAVHYHGTLSGFSSGGTSLDLGDIGFVDAGEATFKGTETGGVLNVTDGTNTARIKLAGDYLGSTFTAQSDGNGGVVVVESGPGSTPPATTPSPHALVFAMAAMAPGHAAVGSLDHAFHEAMPALLGPRVKIA